MAKDAVEVSPETTKKIFENDEVRVLEIEIKPGQKEPLHVHTWKGVVIVDQPAQLRFFDEAGNVVEEITPTTAHWHERQKPHAVENIDTQSFKAHRIEIKK